MIYTRVDTYSVVLYNSSIRDILDKFDIVNENFESAFKSYDKNDVKLGSTFVWTYNGLRFETKLDEKNFIERDIVYNDKEISLLDISFSYLRFYISSEGIDFIESLHKDDDMFSLQVLFSQPDFWYDVCTDFRVTRCDFAFDFVNYEGNEFERLRKIIAKADFDDKLTENGRLYTGAASGLTYSYRGGKERTIYLGSTGADRMLRIYDKKFQVFGYEGSLDTSKVPDVILREEFKNELEIKTWYRVELQTRESFAQRYLVSSQGNFEFIMGEIANFFDVRTKDGKTIAPLHKIFLWTKRTPIIQNAKSTHSINRTDLVKSWTSEIACTNILGIIAVENVEGFCNFINQSVARRMKNFDIKKRATYLNKVNSLVTQLATENNMKFDFFGNIGGLKKHDDGAFYIDTSIFRGEHYKKLYPYNDLE